MKYHIMAFLAGFLLDLLFGDPYFLPHPVRFIGSLTAKLETHFLGTAGSNKEGKAQEKNERDGRKELRQGACTVILVLSGTAAVTTLILFPAYAINTYLGMAVETLMTYQILAAKCLKVESMKVYHCLKNGTLSEARKAVSMIVGRDTDCLDEKGVAKAAVETVAENTSDGVVAPMLYTALGGPLLGFVYKAVNTMDSMIGYQSDKYLYYGRAAARLDDLFNYIPSRISACMMIAASFLGGKCFSGKRAISIYRRDRRNHASPNSAQTESVCAGALGIQLAGDASYFGKTVKKPCIGDALRAVEYEDIKRANRLMYLTAWISELMCLFVMGLIQIGCRG